MLKMKKYSIGLLVSVFIGFASYFSQMPNAYAGMFINMSTPNFAFSIGAGLNAYYTPSVPGYVYYYSYNNLYYMWYNGVLMYAPYFCGPWAPVYTGMIIPRILLSGPPAPPPNFRWGHWGPPPPPPPRDYYNQYRGYVNRPPFQRPEYRNNVGPQRPYQHQEFRPQAQMQRPEQPNGAAGGYSQRPMSGPPHTVQNRTNMQQQRPGPQGFRPQAQMQRPAGPPNRGPQRQQSFAHKGGPAQGRSNGQFNRQDGYPGQQ